jgi:hypothetical protein
MLKKILLLLLFLSAFNCGYEPLYLKKSDLDNKVKSLKLVGDEKINRAITSFLNLNEINNAKTGFELKLISKKKLEVISKDKSGNPSVYKTSIIVNLLISNEGKTIKQKQFTSSFTYNDIENKFELSQYQKNIEKSLINGISEKIFIFLKS